LLIGGDGALVLQRETDRVQSSVQAIFAERIDLESIGCSFGVVTVCRPRSTVSVYPAVPVISFMRDSTSSPFSTTGKIPFWKQLL